MKDHILYRWDSSKAGEPDPSRNDKAAEFKVKLDGMFPKFKENISVTSVKIPITSKGRQQISNEEYLSSSMGVGGHIIGFLMYKLGQEQIDVFQYTTFGASQYTFRDSRHKSLFIIPGSSITKIKDKLYGIKSTALEDTITPCEGILKFYGLGGLMPLPNTNNAEIDFIGNGELEGYMIAFGDEEPEEKEETDEESEEEDRSKRPTYDPFIRKGGAGKTFRSDVGVPPGFSKFLDFIWGEDRIPKDIEFNEIAFDKCPVKGGKRSRTKRRNSKKSQKRRLNTKKVM